MTSKRQSAGSMHLPEGSGETTGMCSFNGFAEIYKRDITYKIITPITSDPDHKDDDTPWTASVHDRVGSSNPIVSRLMIQSDEIINGVLLKDASINRQSVSEKMYLIKEQLLVCEKIQENLAGKINEIAARVERSGLQLDQGGRCLNEFPRVEDLELNVGGFLINANRVMKSICEIPEILRICQSSSNFEHLKKDLLSSRRCDSLCEFVASHVEMGKYIASLRNFHEHPKVHRTEICDFKLTSSKAISPPSWKVVGMYDEFESIGPKMIDIIGGLFCAAEGVFMLSVQESLSGHVPFCFVETPVEQMNPDCPIRYRLSIDASQCD